MGHADFPAEQLSNLIGLIYDCALEPERWQVAIGAIAEACDSRIGIMGIHDLSNSQYGRIYEYGYDPLFWAVYEKYAPENPMFVHGHLREVGEVTTLAMACSDDEFYGSRFYRECLKPYGYLDAMGIHAMRSGSRIAVLATNRTDREPRYSELDVQRLGLLSPHICRAVKISDALELKGSPGYLRLGSRKKRSCSSIQST